MNHTHNPAHGIRIDQRFKGMWHYEEYLMEKLLKEVNQYMFEQNWNEKAKIGIRLLFSIYITKKNIILLYTHPAGELVQHLRKGTVNELMNNTSITSLK